MQLIGMHEERKKIKAAIKHRIPALLIGETGTGKTSLAKEAALEAGLKTVRVNLDGGVTPDEIIGRYQAKADQGVTVTYFQEGVIPRAMREGAVLILDEINAALPDTLFCLHALLEENPRLFIPETQEEIIPAEGFTVIATMNPSHDYAGTKGLNAALYSRFGLVIRFKKLEGAIFLQALSSHVPALTAGKAERICKIMAEVDGLRAAEKINTRLTLREAIAAARLSMDGLTVKEAIESAMISKLEDYERALLTSGFIDPVEDGETVESVFLAALEAKKWQEKAEELQGRLNELHELENVLLTLSKSTDKLASKKRKETAVEAVATGETEIAWNPATVDPWRKKTWRKKK